MEKIRLIELIDQTPAIKSKFKTENITMFSGYDIHTHKRTSGGMDFEIDIQRLRVSTMER